MQLDWETVEALAGRAEAPPSESALLKWRQRRVPFEWRCLLIEIAKKDGRKLHYRDFDSLPKPGRRKAAA